MLDYREMKESCGRCKANAWDCIGEFTPTKGATQEVLECAFCGCRVRVTPGTGLPSSAAKTIAVAPPGDEFRFQFGRFAGLTLAEADSQPNGRKYLEVMRDTNEKLKERIANYLAHAAPSA